MRPVLVSALALVLIPSALGAHPSRRYVKSMNLDGDVARERVEATDNASHSNPRATVVAYDVCNGSTVQHELAPPGKWIVWWALRGTRALGRPGFLFTMGYGQGDVVARVVRLRVQKPGECPTPVALFDYSTTSPPVAPPRGLLVKDFDVSVTDDSKRYPGRELRLEEQYAQTPSGLVRAKRRTYFRYRVKTGRYERYRMMLIQP